MHQGMDAPPGRCIQNVVTVATSSLSSTQTPHDDLLPPQEVPLSPCLVEPKHRWHQPTVVPKPLHPLTLTSSIQSMLCSISWKRCCRVRFISRR